jgi:hypothetical protein
MKEHIEGLSEKLKAILHNELLLGNVITETWEGWPTDSIVVFLKKPFRTNIKKIDKELEYREINDRHYWKAEIHDRKSNRILLCGFDN